MDLGRNSWTVGARRSVCTRLELVLPRRPSSGSAHVLLLPRNRICLTGEGTSRTVPIRFCSGRGSSRLPKLVERLTRVRKGESRIRPKLFVPFACPHPHPSISISFSLLLLKPVSPDTSASGEAESKLGRRFVANTLQSPGARVAGV